MADTNLSEDLQHLDQEIAKLTRRRVELARRLAKVSGVVHSRTTLNKLTMTRIAILRRTPGRHADGGGLYLSVGENPEHRYWTYIYKSGGRRREMSLGPERDLSLAEARQLALKARQLRLQGVDPLAKRHSERAAKRVATARTLTFKECADRYIAAHAGAWSSTKHSAQFQHSLTAYAYPIIGNLPVSAIDTGLILKCIEPIWQDKTETASRTRGRLESVLDWATTRGYRQGENPARWKGHLQHILPARAKLRPPKNFDAMKYTDLPQFMIALQEEITITGTIAARALAFTILTAARAGEVLGCRWSEIDLAERLWTIPAPRMKGRREHKVPLSDPALAIVEEMAAISGDGDLVFAIDGKGVGSTGMFHLLRRLGRTCTTHGFRSTFRVWCAERTNFPSEVCEMALAHRVGDHVFRSYQRSTLFERRRKLADAWARFCCTPAPIGEVVTLARA
jgi:integrase